MRKEELEQALATALNFVAPFKLQKIGSKVSGHVISDTSRGKADSCASRMIWDAWNPPSDQRLPNKWERCWPIRMTSGTLTYPPKRDEGHL